MGTKTTKRKTKSSQAGLQALELYRTRRPLKVNPFLIAMLGRSRAYERAARQQGDTEDAEVYRANAEIVELVLDDGQGGCE